MAIPTTQKECTTRRIASLIIGLWDKVKNAFLLKTSRGAANGVASLDANGKVPTSQLPTVPTGNLPANSSSSAGIVASGSGQDRKVWMTDSDGSPAWRTVGMDSVYELRFGKTGSSITYFHLGTLTPRGTTGNSDTLLVSGTGNSGAMLNTSIIDINFRGTNPSIEYTVLSGNVSSYSDIGWYKDANDVYHLFMKCASWSLADQRIRSLKLGNALTMDCYELSAEPSSPTYITPTYVARLPIGTQKGSTLVPVYVDSNGAIQECTGVAHRWNVPTKAKTWSRIAYVTASEVYGATLILDIACTRSSVIHNATFLIKTAHPGIDASRIIELGSVYYSTTNYRLRLVTANNSNSYIEIYDESNNASAGTVQAWRCTMRIIQSSTISYYTEFTDGTTVPSGFTAGQEIYVRKSTSGKLVTSNGSMGTESIPVYVDSDGNLAQCTNVPVIEHTTIIPADPTVGTIYAL